VANKSKKNGKKVIGENKTVRLTRDEKLASALKRNIKLRKEKKNC